MLVLLRIQNVASEIFSLQCLARVDEQNQYGAQALYTPRLASYYDWGHSSVLCRGSDAH